MKGGVDLATSVLGKHIPVALCGIMDAKALVDAGRLRYLFTFDPPQNFGLDTNISSFDKIFGKSVPNISSSLYLAVPAKTPKEIVEVLERAVEKMTKNPEFGKDLRNIATMPIYKSGKEIMEHDWPETRIPVYKEILNEAGLLK
jgi:tripartite-type tricarboxylate transporter receptor subunit TctC